jgi:hypothetical protein
VPGFAYMFTMLQINDCFVVIVGVFYRNGHKFLFSINLGQINYFLTIVSLLKHIFFVFFVEIVDDFCFKSKSCWLTTFLSHYFFFVTFTFVKCCDIFVVIVYFPGMWGENFFLQKLSILVANQHGANLM